MRFLFIPLILIRVITFSQINTTGIDSLKKYSYMLEVYKDSLKRWHLRGITTGFFVRDSGELYLLTAYHTFAQINSIANTIDSPMLDGMRIRIVDGNNIAWYTINLHKIAVRGKPIMFYKYPDIYAYKLNDDFIKTLNLHSITIHSIENIISENRDKSNTSIKAVFFGFPTFTKDQIFTDATYKDSIYIGNIAPKEFYLRLPLYKGVDSINDILIPSSFNGASGSPVFYIYAKNNIQWIEFGGAMAARDKVFNLSAIVKKKFVVQSFRR